MSLVLWKNRAPLAPWRAFQDLERELDCLWQRTPVGGRTWTPAVDVKETDDAYVISADLPGVKQEEIELTVNGDQGGFSCETVGGSVIFRGNRGIVLGEGTTSASLESVRGVADVAVHMDADFGAGTLTWSCTDVKNKKTKGPFVVPFTGAAAGIDSISIILRGSQGAIDDIRIQGK